MEVNFPLSPYFSCNIPTTQCLRILLLSKTNIFPQFSSWSKIFSFPQIGRLSSHTRATSISYWEYWETSVSTNKQLLLQTTWQTAHFPHSFQNVPKMSHYFKYPQFPTLKISSCIFKHVLVFFDRPTQFADWKRIDFLLGILGTLRSTQLILKIDRPADLSAYNVTAARYLCRFVVVRSC